MAESKVKIKIPKIESFTVYVEASQLISRPNSGLKFCPNCSLYLLLILQSDSAYNSTGYLRKNNKTAI